jgi:hypothetical protein
MDFPAPRRLDRTGASLVIAGPSELTILSFAIQLFQYHTGSMILPSSEILTVQEFYWLLADEDKPFWHRDLQQTTNHCLSTEDARMDQKPGMGVHAKPIP